MNSLDETCQGTVPVTQKIICMSRSYEDTLRLSISLGADADTSGAIVGRLDEETTCTYHHLFNEESKFFLDYAYTNINNAEFHLRDWERNISDHHPLFIEL